MLFNSFVFLFVFLPITYAVFWILPRASWRYVWLAVTGYVFYGYWYPWFCFLMAFSTLVSYLAGLGFLRFTGTGARRVCLVLPITVDLMLLGFFKYANFGMTTAQEALDMIGLGWQLPAEILIGADWKLKFSDIILPVGISFYTFHTISYIVDAYRGVIKPTRTFFEFAANGTIFS